MNKTLLIAVMIAHASFAFAKDNANSTYVGDGRYACRGSSSACAPVDASNRQRERERTYDTQRDQDRAQRYVDRERERESRDRSERYDRQDNSRNGRY